ncbi:MAG: amidohydrolase [Candidatus Hodarchaeales archaeon]
MTLAITGGPALTMDRDRLFIEKATIIIEDNIITEIGSESEVPIPSGAEKIKLGKYHVILPGLINAHTHASMTLLRGYADDMELQEWLTTKIFPLEDKLEPEDVYLGAKLACIESLLGGTTTINSMYHMMDNEAQAIADTGIRGVIGHVCFEWRKEHDKKETVNLAAKWHGREGGRIRVSVDPHTPYTASPEYLLELKDLTADLNHRYGHLGKIIIHTHIAETEEEEDHIIKFLGETGHDPEEYSIKSGSGVYPYLDDLGFFDDSSNEQLITAAHCVALKPADYQIFRKYQGQIAIVHCPVSNLKLGSGIANNTLDMFETMKIAALIHKGVSHRADVVKAEQVLSMATSGEAIHWKMLGKLKNGFLADLIIVNLKKPHLIPVHDVKSHLVYSANSSDVEHVICDGKQIIENGKLLAIDLEQLIDQVEDKKDEILDRT